MICVENLVPDLAREVAAVMFAAFRRSGGYPNLTEETALEEVCDSLAPDRISRVALDGGVIGWIGGEEAYDGHVYELHPLVVRPDRQGEGIGTLLTKDFEQQVRSRGAHAITLGTDDESEQTTLGGVDLYPDPLTHLHAMRNRRNHPFSFYVKLGYTVVGCVPDANGIGKPDILMAKRL